MWDAFDFAANGPMWVGIAVALIVWFFVVRFKAYDGVALAAIIAAVFGAGSAVSYLIKDQPGEVISEVLGRYSFGLFLGTALFFGIAFAVGKKWLPEIRERKPSEPSPNP